MWQPEPGWVPLTGGRGALTVGLWRVDEGGRRFAVKRVRRPGPDEPEYADPAGVGYWRREAEFALAGVRHHGLVPPRVHRLDEDDDGFTVWTDEIARADFGPPALFVVRALARLAADPAPEHPWAARGVLRSRLAFREGWSTLERTTFADLAAELWRRRSSFLDRCDALPIVPAHGDVVPANLLGAFDEAVWAIDWGCYGAAPAGADLGYFALSCREDFDVLLDGYCTALTEYGVETGPTDVAFVARMHAVYTVVARAEWALARVAPGEGPLAAKYHHPAVAPHLRALQRQFPQIEALLNP
ncbi:MAG TPA: phosphotransferase [Marmoricola sp.]